MRGRVEYCINETYYGICADDWGYVHASVVCRQLGFSEYGTKTMPQQQTHLDVYESIYNTE